MSENDELVLTDDSFGNPAYRHQPKTHHYSSDRVLALIETKRDQLLADHPTLAEDSPFRSLDRVNTNIGMIWGASDSVETNRETYLRAFERIAAFAAIAMANLERQKGAPRA